MSIIQAMRGMCKFAQVMSKNKRIPTKSSKEKPNKKKFLEEDFNWAQVNEEEVISLMSFNSDEDNHLNVIPLQPIRGRFYPLIFLVVFLSINLSPAMMNCYGNNLTLQCITNSARNLNPAFDMMYQVGNLACTLLSVLIFCNIYGLQKASGSPAIANGCSANFVLGSLGAVFWMVYAVLGTIPDQGYGINIADEVTLIVYFLISLGYNLFNQVKLKAKIEKSREDFTAKKLAIFFIKNVLCFLIMAIVLSYIALMIGHAVIALRSPQSITMPIIREYIEIAKIVGILMNQFYIALYFIDINFIYDGSFSSAGAHTFEKKLNLSRL